MKIVNKVTMPTVKKLFAELPQNVADKFQANVIAQHGAINYSKNFISLSQMIWSYFKWDKTKEGADYWYDIWQPLQLPF